MPEEPNSGQTGGPKEPEGAAADGKIGADGEPSSGAKATPSDPNQQFVTPEILKGVLNQQQKSFLKELSKFTDPLKQEMESQRTALDKFKADREASKQQDKGGESSAKSQPESPELVELKRKLKELEDRSAKAENEAQESKKRERDFRFKAQVMDALTRHKCLKPEAVFRMIAPELDFQEEANRIFTVLPKNEFGNEEEVELDAYIKRIVSEEMVPQLFEGKMRPGSPAGGEEGAASGKYKYDLEQLAADPDFYVKNAEEIRKALEQGQVKGVKAPVVGKK